jgi:hypothetical protein
MQYTMVASPPPPPPPVVEAPPFYGVSVRSGASVAGTAYGPFTVEQYASWTGYPVTVAQAMIDQAVVDGILVAS